MPQAAQDNLHDYSVTVANLNIELGASFDDFESFDKVLQQRKQYLGERWCKSRNLRTVDKANKMINNPQKHFKESFCYSFITLTCDRGGICRSRASVRKTTTRKMNCPARITLKANRSKSKMIVSECNLNHNHDVGMPKEIRYPSKAEWDDGHDVNLQECTVDDICNTITVKEEPSLPIDPSSRTLIIDVFNPEETITVVDEKLKDHHNSYGIKADDSTRPQPSMSGTSVHQLNSNLHKKKSKDKDLSTKDLLVALFRAREEDKHKNLSRHHNYALTVAEKLDYLDMETSLRARKEIDDLLLKYILKENQ